MSAVRSIAAAIAALLGFLVTLWLCSFVANLLFDAEVISESVWWAIKIGGGAIGGGVVAGQIWGEITKEPTPAQSAESKEI